jgi:hypothetical protein
LPQPFSLQFLDHIQLNLPTGKIDAYKFYLLFPFTDAHGTWRDAYLKKKKRQTGKDARSPLAS